MTVGRIQCRKCMEGKVWLTREQVETGNTTKRGSWTTCRCCKGNYRACDRCTIEAIRKANNEQV